MRGGLGRPSPNALDLVGIGIDSEDFRAATHQIVGVPAIPTSRVEDRHRWCDATSEQLVEEVDIDAAELSVQFLGTARGIRRNQTLERPGYRRRLDDQ